MDTVESAKKTLFKRIGVAETAALFVGLLYVTGYCINSIFVRNYGIPESELFRLEYIKIGFVFWLISAGIVLLPLGAFFLTHKVRKASGLPHFKIGWLGNSLNTIVMIGVPLGLAFFATRYEWYFRLSKPVLSFEMLNIAVGWALALSAFAVICVPFIERIVLRVKSPITKIWIFRLLIEPLRYGCLLVSLYLIVSSFAQIPWLSSVFGRAGAFIGVSILFIGGIVAATYWVRHIRKVSGSSTVFLLVGFGVSFFYYLSLTSYVFGVYPSIPANRGGRMPVTEAYFETGDHTSLFSKELKMQGFSIRGPVYILEQTSDTVYFASESMDKWFQDFIPIHALSSSSVPYIRYERINDGFPRVPRKRE